MKEVIRFFDMVFALIGLLLLSPFLVIIIILIKLDSKGPAIFFQKRVGKDNKDFVMYKFRTMRINTEHKSALTIGKDDRITRMGKFLREYKLDELPQLWNVLKGEMSIVGPRPEVRKFVDHYNDEQKKILTVTPGITDYASILFKNENELLMTVENPEAFYLSEIMPIKIALNQKYISNSSFKVYFLIIFNTCFSVVKRRSPLQIYP